MSEATLAQWLKEGRRFTEEDAILILCSILGDLEQRTHGQAPPPCRPVRLETISWSPAERRARLDGAHDPCPGLAQDLRDLAATLIELLGSTSDGWREALKLAPPFTSALERMLSGKSSSASELRLELTSALGGAVPLRAMLRSRRVQGPVAVALVSALLGWSVYRGATGPNRVLRLNAKVETIAFSEDGRRFAARMEGGVRAWDTETWTNLPTDDVEAWLPRLSATPLRVVSPDGRWNAASDGTELFRIAETAGGAARVLNQETPGVDEGNYRAFTAGAFSPDGRRYAAPVSFYRRGNNLRYIRLWDTSTGALLREKRIRHGVVNPIVRCVALSRRWLAAAAGNDFKTEIHFWDVSR